MKTILGAAAALSLSACTSLPGGDSNSGFPAQALENLRHCKRTYQASLGGFGVPGGSLFIECPAQPYGDTGPGA